MSDFKEKVSEYLLDTNEEELDYDSLIQQVHNWPDISFYNEDEEEMNYEPLGSENCSIIEITDNYIELVAGNDYQSPHLVRVELHEGEFTVTYFEPHEFVTGMDYEEVYDILNS